jgi:hypothetical protein
VVEVEGFRATTLAEVEEAQSPLAGRKNRPGQITSELNGRVASQAEYAGSIPVIGSTSTSGNAAERRFG